MPEHKSKPDQEVPASSAGSDVFQASIQKRVHCLLHRRQQGANESYGYFKIREKVVIVLGFVLNVYLC